MALTTTKVSLAVAVGGIAAVIGAGALIWYFFLRKRIVDFQGTVSIEDDDLEHVTVNYHPTS